MKAIKKLQLYRFKGIFVHLGLCFIFIISKTFSQETTVFQNEENGYKCFRIPAIVSDKDGNLLAFAEGRKTSCADFGDVDIVLKISDDNGLTWSAIQIVADYEQNQVGNPAPVFDFMDKDYPDGRLFLFYNTGIASEQAVREGKAIREIWYKTSTDNGITWSEPTNITEFVSKPNKIEVNPKYNFKEDWRSYANTPGHAIQLRYSKKYIGTIFVAANHSFGTPQKDFKDYYSHAFYTTDHAKTWKITPNIPIKGSNEATAVELSEGKILINCRNQSGEPKNRILATYKLGSKKWNNVRFAKDLPDPVCQGSMIDYINHSGKQTKIYFSNLDSELKRENLTIKVSYNKGKSWKNIETIYKDSAAYSDIINIFQDFIGVLYEKDSYSKIVFTSFLYH